MDSLSIPMPGAASGNVPERVWPFTPRGCLHPSPSRIWGVSSAFPALTLQSTFLISRWESGERSQSLGRCCRISSSMNLLGCSLSSHGILERFRSGWVGRGLKGHFFPGRAVHGGVTAEGREGCAEEALEDRGGGTAEPDELRGLFQLRRRNDLMEPAKPLAQKAQTHCSSPGHSAACPGWHRPPACPVPSGDPAALPAPSLCETRVGKAPMETQR